MKPSIRKQGGTWTVLRPGYGFSNASITEYPSWRRAVDSLTVGTGSAAAIAERATARDWSYATPYRTTIRVQSGGEQ